MYFRISSLLIDVMNRIFSYFFLISSFVITINTFVFGTLSAQNSTVKIIIVAGQSNALNWHADASLLDSSSVDTLIKYFYHTGLPPTRSGSPINSTSGNKWTTLSHQTQDPFTAYNEHFFGPEMTLSRNLYTEIENLAVIKTVYAGTSLAKDWKKGEVSGNELYSLMMAQIDTATNLLTQNGISYKFEGFFWMQGESDAANSTYANNYHSNLEEYIQDVRTDLNTPNLKFILGRIGNSSSYPHKEVVRTTQVNVANDDSYTEWVNTDDLPLDTDNVHLLAEGEIQLGQRMADAWKTLSNLNVTNEIDNTVTGFRLMQNYPNPFNPSTTISFQLPKQLNVLLKIYNMLGQEVVTLLDSRMNSGKHSVTFDASELTSGLYVYKITTSKGSASKKMLLIK